MRLLEAGVDTAVIALWLGHESVKTTQIYVHAHMPLKEQALARTKDFTTKAGPLSTARQTLGLRQSLWVLPSNSPRPRPPTGPIPDRSALIARWA